MKLRKDRDAGDMPIGCLDARNTHRALMFSHKDAHRPTKRFFTKEKEAMQWAKDSLHSGPFVTCQRIEVQVRIKNDRWKTLKTFRGIGQETLNIIERAGAPRKAWQTQGPI